MSTGSKVLLGIVGFVGLCVVVVLMLPSQWSAEESVVINAPPERIHALVENFRYWAEWAGPTERDPSLEYEYSGADKGVGAVQSWTSSAGRGHTTILSSDPDTGVRYEQAFLSDDVNGEATLRYETEADGTRVTWQGTGDVMPVVGTLFIASIESGVADYYRQALGRLKQLAETDVAAAPPDPELR